MNRPLSRLVRSSDLSASSRTRSCICLRTSSACWSSCCCEEMTQGKWQMSDTGKPQRARERRARQAQAVTVIVIAVKRQRAYLDLRNAVGLLSLLLGGTGYGGDHIDTKRNQWSMTKNTRDQYV